MSTIEVDDQTAQKIHATAKALGVSVAALVRSRVLGEAAIEKAPESTPDKKKVAAVDEEIAALEREFDALTFHGPIVSDSRADIYSDE